MRAILAVVGTGGAASVNWKATFLEQRLHVRIVAAEPAVRFSAVRRVAFSEDYFAETLRDGLVPGSTSLEERFPRVGRHHVRPEVAVVPGRVAVAAKQMV